jgi:hypothetical protein
MFHVGCGKQTPELFKGGGDSPEELISMALERLAIKDTAGLQALRITRYEHDSVLIPNHPLGKAPKEMVDIDLAYKMMIQTNTKGLRRAIDDYGGMRFKLVKLEFPAPLEVFGPITVYRRVEATVRDSTGAEFVLPIFAEILTDGHRYKLAAYQD